MTSILIAILGFSSVFCLGAAFLLTVSNRRQIQERLLRQTFLSASGPAVDVTGLLSRVGRSVTRKGPSPKLQRNLVQAGFPSPAAPLVFLGAKVLLFILGGLLVAGYYLLVRQKISLPSQLLMIFLGGAALSFLPNVFVYNRRTKRCREIRHHLPDAVDLLEISVSSGMGLDTAWNMVADEIRQVSPMLADEMALTNLEIHLGVTRTTAMRHMTERTGAEELASLVAVLVQSERFGTSISEVLRVFATTMRELRSSRAEEAAERMAVQLLFPMILFIFPSILVVTAGPAAIMIAQTLFNQ